MTSRAWREHKARRRKMLQDPVFIKCYLGALQHDEFLFFSALEEIAEANNFLTSDLRDILRR
jgi:hypothetical protein